MKNRNFFNLSLFWEGVKQTRVYGFIFAALIAIQLFVTLVLPRNILSKQAELNTLGVQALKPADAAPIINVFRLFGLILVITLFCFMNRRNSSDFYHAVPYTRTCIYISYLASVLFWILCYSLVAFGGTLAITEIFSEHYSLQHLPLLLYTLSNLVATFAIVCGVSLALSMTGTRMPSLILSVLILYMPRWLLSLAGTMLASGLPILEASALPWPLNTSLNLVYSGYNDTLLLSEQWFALLYTALLGLVYFALGLLTFRRRKSETAQKSAPSPRMQAVYRISFTCSFFFVFFALHFGDALREQMNAADCVITTIIGILLYCIYELLTTKSFKKLWKAMPAFLIVVLLTAAFLGGLHCMKTAYLNFEPSLDEVKSVTVVSTVEDATYLSFSDYAKFCAPEIELTDKDILTLATENLCEQTKILREEGYSAFQKAYLSYTYKENITEFLFFNSVTVTPGTYLPLRFSTESGTVTRRVFFTDEELSKFTAFMQQDEAYIAAWKSMPDSIGVPDFFSSVNAQEIDDADILAIYNCAKEELATVDFEEWYAAANSHISDYQLFYQVKGGRAHGAYMDFPIVSYVLPKTANLCIELEYRLQKNAVEKYRATLDYYKSLDKNEQVGWQISFYFQVKNENGYYEEYEAYDRKVADYILEHIRTTPHTAEEGANSVSVFLDSDKYIFDDASQSEIYTSFVSSLYLDDEISLDEIKALAHS